MTVPLGFAEGFGVGGGAEAGGGGGGGGGAVADTDGGVGGAGGWGTPAGDKGRTAMEALGVAEAEAGGGGSGVASTVAADAALSDVPVPELEGRTCVLVWAEAGDSGPWGSVSKVTVALPLNTSANAAKTRTAAAMAAIIIGRFEAGGLFSGAGMPMTADDDAAVASKGDAASAAALGATEMRGSEGWPERRSGSGRPLTMRTMRSTAASCRGPA